MAKAVKDPAAQRTDASLIVILIGFVVVGTLWLALQLGNQLSVTKQNIPANPIAIGAAIARGKLHWPRAATVIVLVVIVLIVAGLFLYRHLQKRQTRGALPIDGKAQYMASSGDLPWLTEAGVRDKAEQLGVRLGYDDPPGVPIGVAVADGQTLWGSYEDLHVDIWGPRQGKTTSRVIPAILSAIGPVLATSNKRDVLDATRDVRYAKGSPVYVFDPTDVAGEPVTWYWDPLAWIDARHEGCEMRAARLAGHFADGDDTGGPNTVAATDTYFDQEAEDLLAGLFLAAAFGERSILHVWDWVTNPQNPEPIEILRAVGHNYVASGLASQYNAESRSRSSIFGTAKKMIRCLKLSNVHPWITPGGDRHQFDEADFLSRNGTLYSLSLEGRGSAAPLVSALTEAVIDVAMRQATRSSGGRLPIPLLAVLDEAANVVRWRDLPKQYSHFGSRGIVVMTVLQSWAQGARCWGADGMDALWAAANIKVLGSGVDDTRFLQERSDAIGMYDVIAGSVSESKGSKSYSRSLSSSTTMSVSTLAQLPRGRVVVFSSGAPAALVRTVPWWDGEYADDVRASIAQHDPQGSRTTMTDLAEELTGRRNAPPQDYDQPEEVQPL